MVSFELLLRQGSPDFEFRPLTSENLGRQSWCDEQKQESLFCSLVSTTNLRYYDNQHFHVDGNFQQNNMMTAEVNKVGELF